MLSNAYFLAKFRFDTAENEPAKNLQNFAKKIARFANFANVAVTETEARDEGDGVGDGLPDAGTPSPRRRGPCPPSPGPAGTA